MKKKYTITGMLTISVHTEIFANSEAEAMKKANRRSVQSLCHQCARGDSKMEFCTSGELDGEPYDLKVEEVEEV